MPFTVITLKKVPLSLRGDLTKWMQEVATGVYVGNFNTKVREQLWNRVRESVQEGEATISFAYRNEIGYQFDTINAQRQVVDSDGIPLIIIPNATENMDTRNALKVGFSNAAKFRKARKFSSAPKVSKGYVVIDIETDGLDPQHHTIIELGAVKWDGSKVQKFNCLIERETSLPPAITRLTGITQQMLNEEGIELKEGLKSFLEFIGNEMLVGYNLDFDLSFITQALKQEGVDRLNNRGIDLLRYVKQESLFLSNYKLQTVLKEYGINEQVPHRATLDAQLILDLSFKVNKFQQAIKRKV